MELKTDKMLADKQDGIGWMTFNNPARRNAVSLEMREAVIEILADFGRDETIRVAVVRGAGGKAFVSGADISEFKDKRDSAEAEERYNAVSERSHRALQGFEKPLIAMIQGFCVGGGVRVALAADLRIASEDARFGIPAAKLGLGYGYDGLKVLSDLVGPAYAREILFTGRLYSAEQAFHMGLVNRVVPVADLEGVVRRTAQDIAANAPLTVRCAKAALGEAVKDPALRDLDKVAAMVRQCFDSNDYKEGREAFMAKRKPVFTGS